MHKNVEIIFVRHGESYGNIGIAEAGFHPDDPRLTAKGTAQALKLAQRFQHENISAIYASALLRACQTVQPLAEAQNKSIIILRELMEVGTEIPNTSPSLVSLYAPNAYSGIVETAALPVLFPPDSGDPRICEQRAAYCMDRILENCTDVDRVVICTHGGFFGYLIRYCLGIALPETFNWQIDNCAVFRILLSDQKIPKLCSANDISHLLQ